MLLPLCDMVYSWHDCVHQTVTSVPWQLGANTCAATPLLQPHSVWDVLLSFLTTRGIKLMLLLHSNEIINNLSVSLLQSTRATCNSALNSHTASMNKLLITVTSLTYKMVYITTVEWLNINSGHRLTKQNRIAFPPPDFSLVMYCFLRIQVGSFNLRDVLYEINRTENWYDLKVNWQKKKKASVSLREGSSLPCILNPHHIFLVAQLHPHYSQLQRLQAWLILLTDK